MMSPSDPRPGDWPHPLLAREGWPFVGLSLIAVIAAAWMSGIVVAAPFAVIPPRRLPSDPLAVLSPADGRIVAIERAQDPYADREALKISVFMNVFNVHSNRVPVDGVVEQVTYFPGRFLNADLDKASLENERNAMVIRRPDGSLVTCVQVAGLIARRILCYVDVGQVLARGTRFGFIRFGSRVDVYLPLDARPRVGIGEKVSATETVLAEY